ncbi:MAG: hypothetical protein H7A53_00085 [Akkermansiaceae bacterium]|nr:hypothetical protein [Akkermansiaceae bacterium]
MTLAIRFFAQFAVLAIGHKTLSGADGFVVVEVKLLDPRLAVKPRRLRAWSMRFQLVAEAELLSGDRCCTARW